MRQKKRPPSLEALYSGALGEIRTPYPLVRSQVFQTPYFCFLSDSYGIQNLSQKRADGLNKSLFCLDRVSTNERKNRAIHSKDLVVNGGMKI